MKSLVLLLAVFVSCTSFADGHGRENRQEKTWGWVGEGGNITVGNYNTIGEGIGATLFITPDDNLSFEVGSGTNYDFTSSFFGDTVNANTTWTGIYYKRFVSNTFYLKAGVEMTAIHYKVAHYQILSSTYTQYADANIYSAVAGIGNQWQWSTFTLGCDWISVGVPFANTYHETDEGPTPTGSAAWDLKEQFTRVGLTITRLYMGMSF